MVPSQALLHLIQSYNCYLKRAHSDLLCFLGFHHKPYPIWCHHKPYPTSFHHKPSPTWSHYTLYPTAQYRPQPHHVPNLKPQTLLHMAPSKTQAAPCAELNVAHNVLVGGLVGCHRVLATLQQVVVGLHVDADATPARTQDGGYGFRWVET